MLLHHARFCLMTLAAGLWLTAPAHAEATFVPGETQYIAALGLSSATSGNDAETWGFWAVDPGPRGVWTRDYADLIANGGVAPDGWQFDGAAWWLEEHGLIMEAPALSATTRAVCGDGRARGDVGADRGRTRCGGASGVEPCRCSHDL